MCAELADEGPKSAFHSAAPPEPPNPPVAGWAAWVWESPRLFSPCIAFCRQGCRSWESLSIPPWWRPTTNLPSISSRTDRRTCGLGEKENRRERERERRPSDPGCVRPRCRGPFGQLRWKQWPVLLQILPILPGADPRLMMMLLLAIYLSVSLYGI